MKNAALKEYETVSRTIGGFDAHPNLFADDWATEHVKIEIFVQTESVDVLIRTIMDIAHVCTAGDGVVAVMPVEKFFSVRSQSEAVL